jgi:site-specific DNA-adenine methylase
MRKKRVPPFLPYYGSKWRLAPKYPAPKYDTIIEPFAGGAGYSLLYPDKEIILIEKDERTAKVWDFLIKASESDIMKLPLLRPDHNLRDFDLSDEEKWLIGWWCNAGAGGPRLRLSKWARDTYPNIPCKYWGAKCRHRIASNVNKINHWKIIHGDYRNFICNNPVTWFVDPPYRDKGKHYKHGSSDLDYKELANWCNSLPGQIIVCENYGAKWLPFKPLCSQVGAFKEGNSRRISIESMYYVKSN